MSFNSSFKRYFGDNAFTWLDRSYITDWVLVLILWLLSEFASAIPIYEREFSIHDPSISNPLRKSQVSSELNNALALYLPAVIVVISGIKNRSLVQSHHGVISVCAGRGLARLITEVLKRIIGGLRPDFLSRCEWDKVLEACTGDAEDILDGRQSFPSGHSSAAFAGMTFLSLWIAGQTAAWCFHAPRPSGSLRSSLMGNFAVTLLPLVWASFVAITRIEDYRHHPEDVIAGSLIGIISAWIFYIMFWPNPFAIENCLDQTIGKPRLLYMGEERNLEYELARSEEDGVNVV